MEAFLVSIASVAVAEMGDRTQLLALVLAARFASPWPIVAGIASATLANHAAAGLAGVWIGRLLTPTVLDAAVGASMLAMALWTLVPDKLDDETGGSPRRRSAFLTTLICFFIAEIGDKTQIATLALAAVYPNLVAVIAGTTGGMLARQCSRGISGQGLRGPAADEGYPLRRGGPVCDSGYRVHGAGDSVLI